MVARPWTAASASSQRLAGIRNVTAAEASSPPAVWSEPLTKPPAATTLSRAAAVAASRSPTSIVSCPVRMISRSGAVALASATWPPLWSGGGAAPLVSPRPVPPLPASADRVADIRKDHRRLTAEQQQGNEHDRGDPPSDRRDRALARNLVEELHDRDARRAGRPPPSMESPNDGPRRGASVEADRLVVDEAGRPEPDRERQQRRAARSVSSSARVGPSATETYSGSASGSAARIAAHRRAQRLAGSLAAGPPRRGAASSARRRTGAAARSAGERWTFRDDSARPSGSRTVGQAMTCGRDREVARHLADDHHLLGVLLAEVGVLGADEVEQDRDDRRDAVEVARPGGALERPRRPRRRDTIVSKPGG